MKSYQFEDTNGVIRIRKSKKNRQHKRKRTNNDLQNTTQKMKYRVTRIPLKTRGELKFSGKFCRSCSTSDMEIVLDTSIRK